MPSCLARQRTLAHSDESSSPGLPVTFRTDIEGLRALSILLVVLYHYFPAVVPGGYIGVDVFFVISGYLITLSLLDQDQLHSSTWIWLSAFWARRARRLLPNAMLVLVCVALAGLIWLSDYAIKRLGSDVFWASTYSINWLFVLRSLDYLQWDDTKLSILLNYWSLAVEEQFYLVWPIVFLLALGRSSRADRPADLRRASSAALLLALVSFAYCLLLSRSHLTLGFLSSPARAWELLTGAWLALRSRITGSSVTPTCLSCIRLAAVAVSAAMLAILGAAGWFTDDTRHPGVVTLLPVLGAAGVIAFGAASPLAQRALGNAPLRWMGARSYSIYLWHWPVMVFGRQLFNGGPPWTQWLLLPASLLLAELAFRWVEMPARLSWGRNWSPWRVLLIAILTSASVAAIGFGLRAMGANNTRELLALHPGSVPGARLLRDLQLAGEDLPITYRNGCHLALEPVDPEPCAFGAPEGSPTAVLFGDSHAAQWFPALEVVATQAGYRLHAWTKSSCPSADVAIWNQVAKGPYRQCELWREQVFARIESMRPRLVIVSNLIEDTTVLTDRESGRPIRGREAQAAFREGLVRTLDRLKRSGAEVVVIRDNPRPRPDVMNCLSSTADAHRCELGRAEATASARLDAEAAGRTGSRLWDFTERICPGGHCPVVVGQPEIVVYRDSNHLTASYMRTLAPDVASEWERTLAGPRRVTAGPSRRR